MSRTYRHMSDWMIARYEKEIEDEEIGPHFGPWPKDEWAFKFHTKKWSRRVKLTSGRPLLNDGNFQRSGYMRKAYKQGRREQRRKDKRLLKTAPDDIENHRAWFCAMCGGHH